ncbi:MAG: translocation/assembly module TamB domain-containing protein [Thermoanaerobaculaceae bacterium]|nr:translocation/assembly module TamB domain-containing protein [Thermoanaerobaculaceae bacterium]
MPRRRPHLTRTTIGLLLAVAVWVAAVAAGLWAIQLPGARAWLADEVARRLAAATGQSVAVASVRVSLAPPGLVVEGLRVGPASAPVLRVATAEVLVGDVSIAGREIGIDHLRLTGVVVDVDVPAASTPRPPGAGWVRVLVRQLEVRDLRVARLALPDGIVFSANDVEARWNGTRRHPISSAVFRAGSVSARIPGVQPITGSVMAWGRQTAAGWELGRLRAQGPGWSVDGRGSGAGTQGSGEGHAVVELAELERVLNIGAGLTGTATLGWRAAVRHDGFRVDADLSCPSFEVAGLHFGAVAGDVHLAPDGLEATLARAAFAGGEIEGSYTLGPLGPPWRHRVALRGRGLDITGFLRELGAPDAGLSARGRVNADVTWDGTAFKAGSGTAVADLQPGGGDVPVAGRIVVSLARDGALAFAAKNTTLAGAPVRWNGRLTLGSWVPSWNIQGERVPVASIARLLRGWVGTDVVPPQLTGEAALAIDLSGPFRDLTVAGDVALAPVAFGPVITDGVKATFRVGQGVLTVDPAVIYVDRGRVTARGSLRYGSGGGLELTFSGHDVPLARMVAWGGVRAPLAGRVAVAGRVAGTLDAPSAQATLRLAGVTAAGVPFGDGSGEVRLADGVVTVSRVAVGPFTASAEINLARREAVVDATLSGFGLEAISPPLARMVGGALDCTLHGAFPFDSPAGRLEVTSAKGARGVVELDAQGIHLELSRPRVWRLAGDLRRSKGEFRGKLAFGVGSWHLLAQDLAGVELPVEGQMAGEAQVRFAPPQPAHIDGVIRQFDLTVEGEHAAITEPARFVVDGGAMSLDGITLVGTRSNLFVRVARSASGTLSGNVSGELPGVLLGLVWRDARPAGRVELLGEISGTDAAPRFEGTARVSDGSLRVPGLPEPATRIAGVLEFTPEAVKLDGVAFAILGGTGVCSGSILLSPQFGLDLALRLNAVRWPLITGLTPILSGDVRLVGTLQDLSLSGKAVLKHTVFRRDLDLQKLVLEQIRAPERARATEGSPMALNLAVDVPSTLEVDTPLARLVARGDLRIVGTTARYGVLGRLEALPGGELDFAGNRYDLDRASVTFMSPDRIEPHLDILARTTVQTYEVTVGLNGTLDRLTPTFSSNPPLPEMDVVSLVSTGQRAAVAGQTGPGALASSFLTDQLTGAVTRRARTLLDVDQMRVDPFAATQSGSPTARLTVVKQMNRDWTVTVATNLAANREEVITSQWRLRQGVYLEANREQDGSYSLEVKWQRRY